MVCCTTSVPANVDKNPIVDNNNNNDGNQNEDDGNTESPSEDSDDNNNDNDNNDSGGQTDVDIAKPEVPDTEIPEVVIPDVDNDELVGDADKETCEAFILLSGSEVEITGEGVSYSIDKQYDVYDADGNATGDKTSYGTVVEISKSGRYVIEGRLDQGFISVSKKELTVTIVLNGVNIYCENYAAITCLKKSDVTIELAEGSTNYLTDGGAGASDGKYCFAYDDEEQPNATILIRKDLLICGTGTLIVNAGLNNGIASRANLTLMDANIQSYAPNNAIKGNDSVTIIGGNYLLVSQSDGIKTESKDEGLGYISITNGDFLITAENDAIDASTSLTLDNPNMKIKTAGGSMVAATSDSAKGLKAATELTILNGSFQIDSNDDSLHSDGSIVIQNGTIIASSADDGIHADQTVTISGGNIDISKSYEGIEGLNINISGGTIRILSTDDGINISGGADSSSTNRPGGGRPNQNGGGGFGAIDGTLNISGGQIYINASGDGLDSNGSIIVTGGTTVVFGPTDSMNAPIDFDGSFTMSGGTIIALGSSGMAQQPGSSSTQYTFLAKFSSAVKADTLLNVSTADGTEIITIRTLKSTNSLVLCSPLLTKASYKINSGGSHSGEPNELGIFTNGSYTLGTTLKSFSINNIVTTVN